MTDQTPTQEPKRRPSIADQTAAVETELRNTGRDFLIGFHTALRSLELYPPANEQVQKALDVLERSAAAVIERESELEVRLSGQLLFVNATRLRIDLRNYTSFGNVLNTMKQCGVGTIAVMDGVTRQDWQDFLLLLLSFTAREKSADFFGELRGKMVKANIGHIALEPPPEGGAEVSDTELFDGELPTIIRQDGEFIENKGQLEDSTCTIYTSSSPVSNAFLAPFEVTARQSLPLPPSSVYSALG